MYSLNDDVLFTTGYNIESNSSRNAPFWYLHKFYLLPGERIIQIRSHDTGSGHAKHLNFQFLIAKEEE